MSALSGDFAWWAKERPHERRLDEGRCRHVGRRPAPGLLLENLEGDLLSASTLAGISADLRRCAGVALSSRGRDHLDDVADQIEHHVRARRLHGERPWR
jgi:hypothetical protein